MAAINSEQVAPTAILYQNSDFVGSLTQASTGGGLALSGQSEYIDKLSESDQKDRGLSGDAKLGGKIPGLAEAGGGVSGSRLRTIGTAEEHHRRHQLDMSYDISYYFHQLRARLAQQTRNVTDLTNAESLTTGDLVTFTGRLQPDPISALLDIASPELAAAVAQFMARRGRLQVTSDTYDLDKIRASWERAEHSAATNADLTRAVTEAIHTDFRRGSTVEFHSEITSGLTGIVVCEREHFVTADPDRLLDGEFTVFGKAVTSPESNVPILRKNKFLRRLSHEWVAWLLDQLKVAASSAEQDDSFRKFVANLRGDETDPDTGTDIPPIDMDFPAVISGQSFVVLPVAIYA